MTKDSPSPGEVWIVTDPQTGEESWQKIRERNPFIITYISSNEIGYVMMTGSPTPVTNHFLRSGPHSFDWHKHCTRIWPPVPSWEDLHATH